MKKIILFILLLTFLTGCTERTKYGDCIGTLDDPKPNLNYRYSTNNIIVAFIFSETIIVPAVVVLDELKCPESLK